MTIIKSSSGKCNVIDTIARNTNSIVYIYDSDFKSLENSIIIDSKEVSLHVLAKEIQEYMFELFNEDKRYDYLIIYTNCEETNVVDFYNAIKDKQMFPVKDIIITCK